MSHSFYTVLLLLCYFLSLYFHFLLLLESSLCFSLAVCDINKNITIKYINIQMWSSNRSEFFKIAEVGSTGNVTRSVFLIWLILAGNKCALCCKSQYMFSVILSFNQDSSHTFIRLWRFEKSWGLCWLMRNRFLLMLNRFYLS